MVNSMVLQTKHPTAEEFERFAGLPENAGRLFEYIEGKIVEVVSSSYSSEVGLLIGALLLMFVREKNLGRVTGADGGYVVSGERYIPELAFISRTRQPEPSQAAYNPNPPDLAVEVLSPTNDPADMRIKIVNYLRAGTAVWVVDPEKKRVEIYIPGQSPRTENIDGVVDGGNILPGFTLSVKSIFPG